MKTTLLTFVTSLGLAAFLTGCGDSSSSSSASAPAPTPPPAPAAPAKPAEPVTKAVEAAGKATTNAAQVAGQEAAKATDATKEKLQEAAKVVQAAAAEAGAVAQEKFNTFVADVKKLIADGKTSEAIQKVQSAFSGLKLSADQQKTVDDLKKQASEALTKQGVDAASKAVGDLLKPKAKN